MLSSTFIFSLTALACCAFLLHKQSQLSLQALLHKQPHVKPCDVQAPARIVSAPSDNTWLCVQKQVKDTVVQIFAHVTEFNWLEPYKAPDQNEGTGSGFFINSNGDMITNYHVVAQASSIEIQIPSFGLERFDVILVGAAPERDIALLTLTEETRQRIKTKLKTIPFLELGDSDSVLRSQEVLALGYPLGQSRLKSTLGIVSGRERLGNGSFIQITAPINPGNSGGPAIDTNGAVIGINSRGILEAQNVGYIIPINEVKCALQDLYKVQLLRKPTLGCIFTASTPEMIKFLGNPGEGGWYIAKVFKGTLLESVGVQDGDMLYAINGHKVDLYGDLDVPWSEDKASLFEFMNRLTVGDTINFTIYRKGKLKEISFKFEHRYLPPIRMIYTEFEPEAIDYEIIGGMVVMPLTLNHVSLLLARVPNLVRYGKIEAQYEPSLLITNILSNSQAFKARVLRPGEVIQEVNGEVVKTMDDFRRAVRKSKETRYLTVKTEDNFYGVMSIDKILNDEDMLASRHFFKKSKLIDELSNTPIGIVQKKK